MIAQEMKKQMATAMKAKDEVTRDILRLALGEVQTAEARENRTLNDEETIAVLRKLVKSIEETVGLTTDEAQAKVLRREIEVLTGLLPARLSIEQIVQALASEHSAIKEAKNDGQATGIAMKHLKASGASVDGRDVGAAIKQIRS
jgi:uncharacterized protein